ncbi:MAG: hypothetical protein K9M97_06590 [Akkermansiaceae bacterium]|nr:hypothetical protein [Akkermansiaceae bacterium]
MPPVNERFRMPPVWVGNGRSASAECRAAGKAPFEGGCDKAAGWPPCGITQGLTREQHADCC